MRRYFLLSLLSLSLAITLGAPSPGVAGPSGDQALTGEQTGVVLVDDFEPQPIQGDPFWNHNRVGGDRGQIDGPGSGSVDWGKGVATAAITGGTNTWIGVWTSLNHPISEGIPLNFSSIFPSQIMPQYQGHVAGVRIQVLDGQGTFQVELQRPNLSFAWRGSVTLTGGKQNVQFGLPVLGEIRNISWIVIGGSGDFATVDQVELIVELPHLDVAQRAFLSSYAMLLANWDPASGLTRDGANSPAGDFDNVSGSGMQAAAAVMAWHLGFTSTSSASDIVESITSSLLSLPRCHGLWPHFITNGQITPGTEWSSLDTIVAIVALLEAREALGLVKTEVEEVLTGIDWASLILDDGSISHGFAYDPVDPDFCGQRLENGWSDFGTESWLANFGYAAATGEVATMDHSPPTFNGSGFIDELAWLLVPAPSEWQAYRRQAADRQLNYYEDHPCYGPLRLFGLSAAEVPDPSAVDPPQIYQAFGVGGEIPANDQALDKAANKHTVIIPHYAAMIASLRYKEASALWKWMEGTGLFTFLNNVESFMFIDEPACEEVVWNALKGSWNLSLQTLGWGRFLAEKDNPLYKATLANDMLSGGYTTMVGPAGDTDGDGCTDLEEKGPDPTLGGQRDQNNPHDFFDVPLPPGPPGTGVKNQAINIFDALGVLAKFGTHDNGTPNDFTDDPPNAGGQKYNPDFDRTLKGPDPWQSGPPNGVINIFDVLRVLAQFGHSCLGPP